MAAPLESGALRSIAPRVSHPLGAARMIEAHRLVEGGGVAGKVVVAPCLEETARQAREPGR